MKPEIVQPSAAPPRFVDVATEWFATPRPGVPSPPGVDVGALVLRTASLLQTTLDPERLLNLFAREARRALAFDGLGFSNPARGVEITVGHAAPHDRHYRLAVEGETLGNIGFSRDAPFSPSEIALQEYLFCSLAYALRNALAHKQVAEDARHDPLTGVYNRQAMESLVQREIALAHRYRVPLCLIFLDIDRFKSINDTFGHIVGDQIIRSFAGRVVKTVRCTDVVSRFGGDEFTVLLGNTPLPGALLLAERIRRNVQDSPCEGGHDARVSITTSLGVSSLGDDDADGVLLAKADRALQRAKELGRNRVSVWEAPTPAKVLPGRP